MELTLSIDEHGRTAAPLHSAKHHHTLNYATNAIMFDNMSETFCDSLIDDCKATTAPELPLTFWLSVEDKPRCLLENLAKDIFMYHVKDTVGLDPKTCGCEWWVQVRPSPNQKRINSMSSEAQRGIQFHWDKDETLRDVGGLFVHPHLSTVTYLTDTGAPTMIYEGSMPNEELMDCGIKGAFVSWPRRGKHLSFDGRFLHGAPWNLEKKLSSDLRVTFLVNIWLHHKPLGVAPFPETLLGIFHSKKATKTMVSSKSPCSTCDVLVRKNTPDTLDFTWGLGDTASIHSKIPINMIREERKADNHNGNITIAWAAGNLATVRANT